MQDLGSFLIIVLIINLHQGHCVWNDCQLQFFTGQHFTGEALLLLYMKKESSLDLKKQDFKIQSIQVIGGSPCCFEINQSGVWKKLSAKEEQIEPMGLQNIQKFIRTCPTALYGDRRHPLWDYLILHTP